MNESRDSYVSSVGAPTDGWEWADSADLKTEEFNRLARDPTAIALVQSRLKRSLKDAGTPGGRVPDVEFMCSGGGEPGRHGTGYALVLAVQDDAVRLFYRYPADAPPPWSRFGVKGEPSRNLDFECRRCGRRYRRTYPEILREGLGALVAAQGRPRIVLR